MNTPLAMKIEQELGLEEGYFMTLQVFYEIREEKKKKNDHPDISKLRRVLFWDTSFEKIDWQQHRRFVIERVFDRGNDIEKEEITHFYGKKLVDKIVADIVAKQM